MPAPAQDSAGFVVEVPAPPQKFLKPGGRQDVPYSSINASPTSDSGNIAARVAMLERKMESCERN